MTELYQPDEACWFVANETLCQNVLEAINEKCGLPDGSSLESPIHYEHNGWCAILFKGNWMQMRNTTILNERGKIMIDADKLTIIEEVGGAAEHKPLVSANYLRDTLGFPQFEETI